MRIPDPVVVHSAMRGSQVALEIGETRVTWEAFDRHVNYVCSQIIAADITSGDRVAFRAGPDVLRAITYLWALLRVQAVAAPLGKRLPGDAVSGMLDEMDVRFYLGSDIASGGDARQLEMELVPGEASKAHTMLSGDALATICRTSGSSGKSKAAVHTVLNHFYSAFSSNERIPLMHGDRWLLTIPVNHVGGLAIVFRCFAAGATVVLPTGLSIDQEIRDANVSHVSVVTTQLQRMLAADDQTFVRGLRTILCGGSAFPVSIIREGIDRGYPIRLTYGLTEASSQVATTKVLSIGADPGSSGRPMKHVAVNTDSGEILVRGETVFAGYLTSGGIDSARDEDGWFHTGDTGHLKSGELKVSGRKDNMFISGGENIQPEEIEFFLTSIDSIERAVVVPISDNEFGFRPAAYLETTEGFERGDMVDELKRVLPPFKVPIRYFRLLAGDAEFSKVDRDRLAKEASKRTDDDY